MNKRNIILTILVAFVCLSNGLALSWNDELSEPGLRLHLSSEKTNCPNDMTGSASVDVSGGKPPYNYEWSNGEKTATITNLTAGGYFVTVTDSKGTSKTGHITVEATNKFDLDFVVQTLECAHDTDGKIEAIPIGGTAPYTYQWSTGSEALSLENLGAGMYMLTVTDANGCQAEGMVMLEEPEKIHLDAVLLHVSCDAEADGSMRVEASGGTGNYTFLWELDGEGGDRRENLPPGLYSVTVTDENGCTAMICPEIIQSTPPILSASVVPETCPGEGDGKIIITANGDSPPYTYQWEDDIAQFGIADNLSPGTYAVTVTNFRNCSTSIEVTVGQAGGGFGFFVETNGRACGATADGRAEVIITGGVAPFSYEWVNKNTEVVVGRTATVNNLQAGEYTVLVRDANGCFGKRDILIVEKPVPIVEATATIPEVCFGEATGAATADATGGEGSFTYAWSNGQQGQNIENLAAGIYIVTATDENGCTDTDQVTIIERPQILITETVTDLVCYEEPTGRIELAVTGGSGTYTYLWSDGSTASSIENSLAGTLFVTVTDSEGCQATKGITIDQPAPITIDAVVINAADLDSSDGAIEVTVTGGTAPYTYLWNTGATTQNIQDLPAGGYQLVVTDANGCQQEILILVEANCTLMAAITNVRPTTCALNDGAITVSFSGEMGEVEFLWSNGATTSAIAGLAPGFYGVTLTDGNGCTYSSGAVVTDGCDCIAPVIEDVLVFEATCGEEDGSIAIRMRGGNDNFDFKWASTAIAGAGSSNLAAGAYEVTISDKNDANCSITEIIPVGNTNIGPVFELQNEPEVCNGTKGSVLLLPSGLEYSWSDGGTGGSRNDLAAGEYHVTVTIPGSDDCRDIISVNIDLVSDLALTPVFNQLPDCGASNGTVTIEVEGGSGNYDYSWGGASQANLPAGTYNVEVTDKISGCSESILFTLVENTASINITIDSLSNVSCAGGMDGRVVYSHDADASVSISLINENGKAFQANALEAGNYCLIAEDNDGCLVGQRCFTITEPDFLFVTVTVIPQTCNNENAILLSTSGGNGVYTYDWADQNGDINPRDRRGIENGVYSVTVSDELGCSLPIDEIVIEGECFICTLEATASIDVLPECGLPNGAATINVVNSFGNLSYSWGDTPSRADLVAGAYTITVVDDFRGCETEVSFNLEEPVLPDNATISELIVCPDETGQLIYDVSNFKCAAQPVSVLITDDAGTIYDENALPAFNNYIFVVRDANGVELNRQFFSVGGYEPIISNAALRDEGCTTLGRIDLDLNQPLSELTIQWADLNGDNQSANRTDLSAGTYMVTISNNFGCVVTREFLIEKNTEISANLSPAVLICDAAPVQLNLEGEGLITYAWSPANLISEGQGTSNPIIQIEGEEALITVSATNAFGCTVVRQSRITSVITDPPGGIGVSPQCDGLTIDFTSQGNSTQFYTWDFGDGNSSEEANPSHTYVEAGNYTVSLKLRPDVTCAADKEIIASQELNLVEDAGAIADFTIDYDPCMDEGVVRFLNTSVSKPGEITTWKWDFGNGETSSEENPVLTLSETADLDISLEVVSNLGCEARTIKSESFKVVKMPKMLDSLQICPGMPTQLNPNPQTEGVTYEWRPSELLDNPNIANPTAVTNTSVEFAVTITQEECVREDIVKAIVPEEQDYQLSEDEIVCSDSARLIFVEAPSTSVIEWTDISGAVISGEEEIIVAPGTYTVKLTDPNNCEVTDQVVIENFAINAIIDNNTDPCTGGIGQLEVINNSFTPISSYQWTDSEGIISADLNQPIIEVEPSETTDYTVTIENEFGCTASIDQTVLVSEVEDLEVQVVRDTIFNGEFTPINVLASEDYIVEWVVDQTIDDLSSFSPNASPEETTTYTVTVTDINTNCSAARNVTVFVRQVLCGEPNIFFPNAFSPNGDGNNDVLMVRGNAISSIQFSIYNRWGEKVFESFDKEVGWDGTFNGQQVGSDVYGYYLRVVCLAGDIYETQGNVTVLR